MSGFADAQNDESMQRLLRTAFPALHGQKCLTHEECVSLYGSVDSLSPDEFAFCLGQVLLDLFSSHEWQTEPRKVSKAYMVVQTLDVLVGGVDYGHILSSFGESGLRQMRETDDHLRDSLLSLFSGFSTLQASAIVAWLRCAKLWPGMQEDMAHVNAALDYWEDRSKGVERKGPVDIRDSK